jgi:hypothetical protein
MRPLQAMNGKPQAKPRDGRPWALLFVAQIQRT